MPVFVASLADDGGPDRRDQRWQGWQRTRCDPDIVATWQPGDALCAVTGVVFDVLDVDPRNGGRASLDAMSEDLGEDGPEVFWEVRTPQGGWHLYILSLGIGSHNGFMPGLDLKGGKPDKTGRGFVFAPPTQRLGGGYRPLRPLAEPVGKPCQALAEYIERCLEEKQHGPTDGGKRAGRQDSDTLREAVLQAGPGAQREALLRFVHELERRGLAAPDIRDVLRGLLPQVRNYDDRNPWYPAKGGNPDRWISTLLHRPGTVLPDAAPGELDGIHDPVRAGLVRPLSSLRREHIRWLWGRYLALGNLTLSDGEKGIGKTFVLFDIAARLSRNLPMPGMDEPYGEPVNVMIFGEEDNEAIVAARAEAAGMDMDRVFIRSTPKITRKGKVYGEEYALPNGAVNIGRAIVAAGALLAIFDPVTDFLGEDVQSHNDASVRRALRPLAHELGRIGVAGWALRHMNKNTGADARMRGSGSTAFQNRARVHLVAGRMPEGHDGAGQFGIAMADTNLTKKVEGVLPYTIEDSEVSMDEAGTYAGRVVWHDIIEDMDANDLLSAGTKRRGHIAVAASQIRMALQEMFELKPEWPASKAMEELRTVWDIGATEKTIHTTRRAMGITAVRRAKRGVVGGTDHWVWVLGDSPEKSRVSE